MKLMGLQKLTLLDFPGKMACTVFTGGCNFRCPFCHNASLVLRPSEGAELPEAEFFAFLRKRTGLLDGVCVTGGEPLLNPELPEFLAKIRELGYLVKLDTNGSFPDRLGEILSAGLADYVAMDVKAGRANYCAAAGCPELETERISRSIRLLMGGQTGYEFRTTVVKGLHTRADFTDLAAWLAGAERYFLQGFVDSGDLIGTGYAAFSPAEMRDFLSTVQRTVPNAELRGI